MAMIAVVAGACGAVSFSGNYSHSKKCCWVSCFFPANLYTLCKFVIFLLATRQISVYGIGNESLRDAMYNDYDFGGFLALFLAKQTAVVICAALGAPGGLLSPALVVGGLLGGCCGVILEAIDATYFNLHYCVIFGMSGGFAGMFRTPITAIVLIYELTGVTHIHKTLHLLINVTHNMQLSFFVFFFCRSNVCVWLDWVAGVAHYDSEFCSLTRSTAVTTCQRTFTPPKKMFQKQMLVLRIFYINIFFVLINVLTRFFFFLVL